MLAALLVTASGCQRDHLDGQGHPVKVGAFRLRTFPAGAEVWIGDKLMVEATPATLVLPAGKYRLKIQARGAEPTTEDIEVAAGESRELTLDIPRPPDARISVASDEPNADVRINGYRRGATPLSPVVTRPGPVDITVTTADGRARSVRTSLAIGEQKHVDVIFSRPDSATTAHDRGALMSNAGWLTLGLKPDGTVFSADGARLGDTPLVHQAIEAGTHVLVLRSLDGRYEKHVEVAIDPGQSAVFRFQFREEDQVGGRHAPQRDGGR